MVKISHAAPFASWLIVTGRLRVTARFVIAVGLRHGHAASLYQPLAYECFRQAAAQLETGSADVRLQWHALVLLAAAVGRTVDQVDEAFTAGRAALLAAYRERDRRNAGRTSSAILHRLQTTLFHGEIIETIARPRKPGIRETGWDGIAAACSEAAPPLSGPGDGQPPAINPQEHRAGPSWLRPLPRPKYPEIHRLNQLTRTHIEAYKARLTHRPTDVEHHLDCLPRTTTLVAALRAAPGISPHPPLSGRPSRRVPQRSTLCREWRPRKNSVGLLAER